VIKRRWYSSGPVVPSFKGIDCQTEHYLVVVKIRERLAVNIKKGNADFIWISSTQRN
jgi:hypothetical protein